MPTTFEPATEHEREIIARSLKAHHPELHQAGVTIDAVFAAATDTKDFPRPAMKRQGYVIAAKIQITPLVDRARGMADAKLTICQMAWDRLNEASREALIDHELTHLERRIGKKDNGIDDLGRPKLKMRAHDWELTGFAEVVERHGESSLEAQQIARFRGNFEQLDLFPKNKAA